MGSGRNELRVNAGVGFGTVYIFATGKRDSSAASKANKETGPPSLPGDKKTRQPSLSGNIGSVRCVGASEDGRKKAVQERSPKVASGVVDQIRKFLARVANVLPGATKHAARNNSVVVGNLGQPVVSNKASIEWTPEAIGDMFMRPLTSGLARKNVEAAQTLLNNAANESSANGGGCSESTLSGTSSWKEASQMSETGVLRSLATWFKGVALAEKVARECRPDWCDNELMSRALNLSKARVGDDSLSAWGDHSAFTKLSQQPVDRQREVLRHLAKCLGEFKQLRESFVSAASASTLSSPTSVSCVDGSKTESVVRAYSKADAKIIAPEFRVADSASLGSSNGEMPVTLRAKNRSTGAVTSHAAVSSRDVKEHDAADVAARTNANVLKRGDAFRIGPRPKVIDKRQGLVDVRSQEGGSSLDRDATMQAVTAAADSSNPARRRGHVVPTESGRKEGYAASFSETMSFWEAQARKPDAPVARVVPQTNDVRPGKRRYRA